jgi:hypothetical protein
MDDDDDDVDDDDGDDADDDDDDDIHRVRFQQTSRQYDFNNKSTQRKIFTTLGFTTLWKTVKKVKVKVKQSRYRHGVAQRVPGS